MNTQMKTFMYQRIFNPSICRILFATCLSALCLIALSTQAATITVTNTNDSGAGSLRQAIADAVNGDTIDFGVTGTITLTTGELLVDKSITINGPGSDHLTVDGNHASRVFYVGSVGVTATIAGLTITNGNAADRAEVVASTTNQSVLTVSNCNDQSATSRPVWWAVAFTTTVVTARTRNAGGTNSTISGNSARWQRRRHLQRRRFTTPRR